jgi:phage-related protein (TIGR01555 family)
MSLQVTIETPNTVDNALNNIRNLSRANALFSESMGINIKGGDATQDIGVSDSPIFGGEARNLYRNLDVVQRIIDAPAQDALRQGFKIKTNYDDEGVELDKLLMERLESLDYKRKFQQFLIYTRLYSRGAMVYPIVKERGMMPNRAHLGKSMKLEDVEKVMKLNIVREELFSYQVQSYDPLAANFEEFMSVWIMGHDVHDSRFHLLVQNLDPVRQRGASTLERIKTACMGINVAEWTITQLLLRYRALLIKYPAEELARVKIGERNGLMKRIAELVQAVKLQFSAKSVVGIPSNYDFEYLQTSFEGLKDATDFLYSFLSTVTRVPQNILRGSAMGELASSEKDQRDYYELVKSEEQNLKLEPALQWLFPFLIYEREGQIYQRCKEHGIDLADVNPIVEFNPLQSVNPMVDAQIQQTKVTTYSLAKQSGLFPTAALQDEAMKDLFPHIDRSQFAEQDTSETATPPEDPWGLFTQTKVNMPTVWKKLEELAKKKVA